MVQKENNIIDSYEEEDHRIQNDPHKILFAESPMFENDYKGFPCNVVSTDKFYGRHYGAYGLRKEFFYRKLFNHFIRHTKESGLLPECNECKQRIRRTCLSGNVYRPLGYDNIFSAFVLSCCGVALAIFYCVLEVAYKNVI